MRPIRVLPLLLAVVAAATPVSAQIGVSPPRVELAIESRPTTESIRLFNLGAEPRAVRVSVYNWDLDENNEIRILPPDEQSLDQWVVINPLQFTVAPGRSQVVRFSVRPRVEPAPGEHRAVIFFDEVDARPAAAGEAKVFFRLGVVVYGYAGDVERVGVLDAVRVNASSVGLDLSSRGTAHVRLDARFAVWQADRYPGPGDGTDTVEPSGALEAGSLPTHPILPGARRKLAVQFGRRLPPGDYVLDLRGNLSGEPIDRGIRFSVFDEQNLARIESP